MKPKEKVLIPPYFGSIRIWKEILDSKITWDIHKNYIKQTYRNRTYIHSANCLQNLTVPIKHSFEKFSMQSAIIDNKGNIIKQLNRNESGNIEFEIPLIKSNKNKNDLIFFILLITYLFIFLIYKKKNDKK